MTQFSRISIGPCKYPIKKTFPNLFRAESYRPGSGASSGNGQKFGGQGGHQLQVESFRLLDRVRMNFTPKVCPKFWDKMQRENFVRNLGQSLRRRVCPKFWTR
jgi:hypothetical protein